MRKHLSFANVTSMSPCSSRSAGRAYAAAPAPANSVGKAQIRSSAVGKSEAATSSVGRSEVRSSAIGTSEIASNGVGVVGDQTTRSARGDPRRQDRRRRPLASAAQAANGVTFRASVSDAGRRPAATPRARPAPPTGVYSVDLGTDVSKCQVSATIAGTGATNGTVIVTPGASTNLLTVNAFDTAAPPSRRTGRSTCSSPAERRRSTTATWLATLGHVAVWSPREPWASGRENDSHQARDDKVGELGRAYAAACCPATRSAAELVIRDALDADLTSPRSTRRSSRRRCGSSASCGSAERSRSADEHVATEISVRVLALEREARTRGRGRPAHLDHAGDAAG